jgi:hypothetical protein
MDKKQTSYLNELISGYKQHLCYSLINFTENKHNITLGRNGALIWSKNKILVKINPFTKSQILNFRSNGLEMETRGMVSTFEDNLVLTDRSNYEGIVLSTNLQKFVSSILKHPQYGNLIREGTVENILVNKGIYLKPIMMYNPNESEKINLVGFHEKDNIKTLSDEKLTDKISNFFMKPNEQL